MGLLNMKNKSFGFTLSEIMIALALIGAVAAMTIPTVGSSVQQRARLAEFRTAGNIASKTVRKMIDEFNSKPENIVALIGPAIGFCCYNVGEEVYQKLSKTVNNFERLYEIREGNIFVDLKNINKRQLEEIGVQKIDVCPYCTVHNNNLFYSYRNENATPYRHSAVLKLN
jgi:prepilin-type N-terminal cleavage/methylation domain-containing protein